MTKEVIDVVAEKGAPITVTPMKELRWAMAAFRVAMGVTFLSPVADRFGLWGPPGAPNVS